jgi:hypothetical protein
VQQTVLLLVLLVLLLLVLLQALMVCDMLLLLLFMFCSNAGQRLHHRRTCGHWQPCSSVPAESSIAGQHARHPAPEHRSRHWPV